MLSDTNANLVGSPKSLWMAPCFYCRPPVPMDEYPEKLGDHKLPVWVGILLGILVVTLMITLQMEMAGGRKQLELVQKLHEEIKTLNQELQEKSWELGKKSMELEQLRQENEALVSAKCPRNSGISLRLSVAPAGLTVLVLLTLSLQALLA